MAKKKAETDMTTGTAVLVKISTPKGNEAVYLTRDGTSDAALVFGIIGEDEYNLKDLPELKGWAIDIGAHIGTVAVALALDHPDLHVIAVEALLNNVETLRENVKLNGLERRVDVVWAGATDDDQAPVEVAYGWSRADNQPDHYMQDNRYIGGMVGPNETGQVETCLGVGLGPLTYDIDSIALLKIDCEGCEWRFLTSPAIAKCERIWGEYHEALNPENTYARLLELLTPTHDVEHIRGTNVGIFRATRR